MTHPEKKIARRYDTPGRCAEFTDQVYKDAGVSWADLNRAEHKFDPAPPEYSAYIGEMHGHTTLSDGSVDIDTYFRNLKSRGIDFAAIADHDHGGLPVQRAGGLYQLDLVRVQRQALLAVAADAHRRAGHAAEIIA